MAEQLSTLIGSVGFPAFITVYLLLRFEPTIKRLEMTVATLTVVVAKQTGVDYHEARKMSGEDDLYRTKKK